MYHNYGSTEQTTFQQAKNDENNNNIIMMEPSPVYDTISDHEPLPLEPEVSGIAMTAAAHDNFKEVTKNVAYTCIPKFNDKLTVKLQTRSVSF